eukprot:TRINITY_DN844_c0_g1_i1.p1 TRINITY_DN844_c0_g1~~TRINITY_DN844_c0_g1_i1.p1  ORF type:complete len:492 (-),score=77.39 TRINITY_DN844_c0_g1_i1:122-1597(-)
MKEISKSFSSDIEFGKNIELIDPNSASEGSKDSPISALAAAKDLILLALPNTATYVLQNLADFLSLYFIGLTGDARYTGIVGLGITWYNISAYSVILGFCSTIDTFVPQCFGSKQYQTCGLWYYRAVVIVFLTCVPFVALLYLGGSIFSLLGMDEFTAVSAGAYGRMLVPNLFINAQYELLRKFLNAQRIANPTTAVAVITTLLHPLWCYLFIFKFYDGSYLGAALAKTLSNLISLALLVLYIKFSGCCKDTLCPVDFSKLWSNWKPFLILAIPSALMIVLDWWAYEIMNVMAGILGANELSANVALVQINLLFFMIPVGIGSATCAFVGNSIGANKESACKFYIAIGFAINFPTILFLSVVALIFRHSIAYYFFHDDSVIDLFTGTIFILILSGLFDTTQGFFSRIFIGMGKQYLATAAVIIAYYGIMIPAAYVFLFVLRKGLYGLWYANLLAAFSLALIFLYFLVKADWKEIIRKMNERQSNHSKEGVI